VDGTRLTCRVINVCGYHWERFIVPSRTLALGFLWESLALKVSRYWRDGREVTSDEGRAFAESTPLGQAIASRPFYENECWYQSNAGQFISCVGVADRDNWDQECPDEGFAPGEEPQATFLIAVTDPQWLAHLGPGIEWNSTAYDQDTKLDFHHAWHTTDVLALARGISSSQNFSDMPILGDALQDAGCDSADILNHLRDPHASHVRGCWALDLIRSKE